MRTIFVLLLTPLLTTPATAQAGVDFKCDSVKFSDQISGILRFGANGGNGHLVLEYWNGYPPITIVEGDLDNGAPIGTSTRFVSEADRHDGTVAVVDVPADFLNKEKFIATAKTQKPIPRNNPTKRKPVVETFSLSCVRH